MSGEESKGQELARARSASSSAPSSPRDPDGAHYRMGGKDGISKYANLSHDDASARFNDDKHHYHGPSGPFFTQVKEKLGDKEVLWDARRHRRNRPQRRPKRHEGDDIEAEGASEASSELYAEFWGGVTGPRVRDALWVISAVVGPSFAIGSALFVLGGVAGLWPGYDEDEWSTSKTDWLVNVPYLVGALFFLLGAYATVLEAANVDYRSDVRRWRERVKRGGGGDEGGVEEGTGMGVDGMQKPTLNLAPIVEHVKHAFLSYFGSHLQYGGAALYVVATLSQLLSSHFEFSDKLTTWLVTTPYFVGGACFVAGGYLMAVEARHAWLYGVLPPFPSRVREVGDWVQFLNFAGSFLFFVGGILLYDPAPNSTRAWQLCSGLTFVPGSILFLIQAVLLTLETVFPQW